MTITSAMRLSHTPTLTICLILTSPLPNATAFEGVATGSMKAEHTARVTTMVMNSGSIPTPMATAPMMGKNAAAVAVLLVSSVNAKPMMATAPRIRIVGSASRFVTCSPIHVEKPVAVKATERLKPPPNKRRRPHGISLAELHWSRA